MAFGTRAHIRRVTINSRRSAARSLEKSWTNVGNRGGGRRVVFHFVHCRGTQFRSLLWLLFFRSPTALARGVYVPRRTARADICAPIRYCVSLRRNKRRNIPANRPPSPRTLRILSPKSNRSVYLRRARETIASTRPPDRPTERCLSVPFASTVLPDNRFADKPETGPCNSASFRPLWPVINHRAPMRYRSAGYRAFHCAGADFRE